jgi:cysteinyl-tRNA synthetase
LQDDDDEKLRSIGMEAGAKAPSNEQIEELVTARQVARKTRDFAKADRIRQDLANQGIILEDSKDGIVRWKRK